MGVFSAMKKLLTIEQIFNYNIKQLNNCSINRRGIMAKNEYICDCKPINEKQVMSAKGSMLSANIYEEVASFFKIVGDPTRCKIISVLKENEMCVGDISNVLSMTKSSICHKLSKVKGQGVVKSRKEGKEVYYSLDDEHVAEIFALTVEHITHIQH